MSKKHIFICLFFMLFLVGCQNNKKVKTDKKVDITAYYYHNNTPQYSVQINAIHLQTALDKVRTGEFESKTLHTILLIVSSGSTKLVVKKSLWIITIDLVLV